MEAFRRPPDPAADAAPARAQWVLAADDLVAGQLAGARPMLAAQRRRLALYGALAATLALVSALGPGTDAITFGYLGAVALALFVVVGLTPQLYARRLRALFARRADVGRRVTYTLSPDALWASVGGMHETRYRPDALHAVEVREGGLLVEPVAGLYAWVPDRAFASAAERARFHDALLRAAPLPRPDA